MRRVIVIFILLVFCILSADTFSIQGVLRDPLGKTVEDGYYNLIFRIYEIYMGDSNNWEESQGSVVTDGIFGVELGAITSVDDVAFDTNYQVGVVVNESAEMEPHFNLMKQYSHGYSRILLFASYYCNSLSSNNNGLFYLAYHCVPLFLFQLLS